MAKISAKYKVIYIIDPAQGEEGIAALVEKSSRRWWKRRGLVSLDELGSVVWPTHQRSARGLLCPDDL